MSARDGVTRWQILVLLLILALGSLPTLGFASPPDPTWIAGIYDDADADDVVVLVTSTTSCDVTAPVADLLPMLAGPGDVPPSAEEFVSGSSPSAVLPRGPPAS